MFREPKATRCSGKTVAFATSYGEQTDFRVHGAHQLRSVPSFDVRLLTLVRAIFPTCGEPCQRSENTMKERMSVHIHLSQLNVWG